MSGTDSLCQWDCVQGWVLRKDLEGEALSFDSVTNLLRISAWIFLT
jgi:hypothetical protein